MSTTTVEIKEKSFGGSTTPYLLTEEVSLIGPSGVTRDLRIAFVSIYLAQSGVLTIVPLESVTLVFKGRPLRPHESRVVQTGEPFSTSNGYELTFRQRARLSVPLSTMAVTEVQNDDEDEEDDTEMVGENRHEIKPEDATHSSLALRTLPLPGVSDHSSSTVPLPVANATATLAQPGDGFGGTHPTMTAHMDAAGTLAMVDTDDEYDEKEKVSDGNELPTQTQNVDRTSQRTVTLTEAGEEDDLEQLVTQIDDGDVAINEFKPTEEDTPAENGDDVKSVASEDLLIQSRSDKVVTPGRVPTVLSPVFSTPSRRNSRALLDTTLTSPSGTFDRMSEEEIKAELKHFGLSPQGSRHDLVRKLAVHRTLIHDSKREDAEAAQTKTPTTRGKSPLSISTTATTLRVNPEVKTPTSGIAIATAPGEDTSAPTLKIDNAETQDLDEAAAHKSLAVPQAIGFLRQSEEKEEDAALSDAPDDASVESVDNSELKRKRNGRLSFEALDSPRHNKSPVQRASQKETDLGPHKSDPEAKPELPAQQSESEQVVDAPQSQVQAAVVLNSLRRSESPSEPPLGAKKRESKKAVPASNAIEKAEKVRTRNSRKATVEELDASADISSNAVKGDVTAAGVRGRKDGTIAVKKKDSIVPQRDLSKVEEGPKVEKSPKPGVAQSILTTTEGTADGPLVDSQRIKRGRKSVETIGEAPKVITDEVGKDDLKDNSTKKGSRKRTQALKVLEEEDVKRTRDVDTVNKRHASPTSVPDESDATSSKFEKKKKANEESLNIRKSQVSPAKIVPHIVFTNLEETPQYRAYVEKLGGKVVEGANAKEWSKVTHLVCLSGSMKRTLKLIRAMAVPGKSSPRIVHLAWLVDSAAKGEIQDELMYVPYEDDDSMKDALRLRDRDNSRGLLDGITVLVAEKNLVPAYDEFVSIVTAAGGTIHFATKELLTSSSPKATIVIGAKDAFSNPLRKLVETKKLTWCTFSWLAQSITSYTLLMGSGHSDNIISAGMILS